MIISKITDYEMPRDLKGHKNQEICKRAARQTNVFISAPKMGTGRRIKADSPLELFFIPWKNCGLENLKIESHTAANYHIFSKNSLEFDEK